MVRDFHVTKSERTIGYYSGMIGAAFGIGQFASSFLWGSISDRIGRKPVLLIGM